MLGSYLVNSFNKVFDEKVLNRLIKEVTIINLKDYQESEWGGLLKMIISKYCINAKDENIVFLKLGNLRDDKLKTFKKIFSKSNMNKEINISDTIINFKDNAKQKLLIAFNKFFWNKVWKH